jgi:hypothetical protein
LYYAADQLPGDVRASCVASFGNSFSIQTSARCIAGLGGTARHMIFGQYSPWENAAAADVLDACDSGH